MVAFFRFSPFGSHFSNLTPGVNPEFALHYKCPWGRQRRLRSHGFFQEKWENAEIGRGQTGILAAGTDTTTGARAGRVRVEGTTTITGQATAEEAWPGKTRVGGTTTPTCQRTAEGPGPGLTCVEETMARARRSEPAPNPAFRDQAVLEKRRRSVHQPLNGALPRPTLASHLPRCHLPNHPIMWPSSNRHL